MSDLKTIKTALISVYDKRGLERIIHRLKELDVSLISTGGTKQYLESYGATVTAVEDITSYPSILGGRVKTLHPKIFGGILCRRDSESDRGQSEEYDIPPVDLVVVDLYPFEETLASGATAGEIIEKIDIGGISLIRAAAKNHEDVLVVPSKHQYQELLDILDRGGGVTTAGQRRSFAARAFQVSSHYDTIIYRYLSDGDRTVFKQSITAGIKLRYGENPHQEGYFYGDFDAMFTKLWGKEISYNNLLDIDAALNLIHEFSEPAFAILKHNNACGLACRNDLKKAWEDALAGDPVSAFGGILITNQQLDAGTADEIDKLFFEVIIAPSYQEKALEILRQKKNRIILVLKKSEPPEMQYRSVLNGVLLQERDSSMEGEEQFRLVTERKPTDQETGDLIFANKLVKHTKSNAIVLARNKQLLASGVGQTSRVDALRQAIEKAGRFGFNLQGAVMASDAFFPFADSVEIASKEGITAVIQPGGSVRDKESVDFCNLAGMSMVFTGIRHFKH